MGICQNAMARAIGVSPRAFNEIVLRQRSITPPTSIMSIRFGAFFGQSEDFWHRIPSRVRLPQAGWAQEQTDSRGSTCCRAMVTVHSSREFRVAACWGWVKQ